MELKLRKHLEGLDSGFTWIVVDHMSEKTDSYNLNRLVLAQKYSNIKTTRTGFQGFTGEISRVANKAVSQVILSLFSFLKISISAIVRLYLDQES